MFGGADITAATTTLSSFLPLILGGSLFSLVTYYVTVFTSMFFTASLEGISSKDVYDMSIEKKYFVFLSRYEYNGTTNSLVPGNHADVYIFAFRSFGIAKISITKQDTSLSANVVERIVVYGWGAQKNLDVLVQEWREYQAERSAKKVMVYTSGDYSLRHYQRPTRAFSSFIGNRRVIDLLTTRITEFLGAGNSYHIHGRTHKLGILLEGAPGMGKSSLVVALASHFRLPIRILNPSSLKSLTETMAMLRDTFVLFEDIDDFFTRVNVGKTESVDIADVLNGIDGVLSPNNVVIFFTTNYPDRIDARALRPGRIDIRVKVESPIRADYVAYTSMHFPHFSVRDIDDAASECVKHSPAAVQEVFIRHAGAKSARNLVKTLRTLALNE